jgi:hypothetical protein
MSKKVILSLVLFFTLQFFYTQVCISQEHPLAGKDRGKIYFMKNLTYDDITDITNDTIAFINLDDNVPDIWARAFLKHNLQYYDDYLKKKHEKILNMRIKVTLEFKGDYISPDGKIHDNRSFNSKKIENIEVQSIPDLNVNTIMFKLNDFEKFNSTIQTCLQGRGKDETLKLKLGMQLHYECEYVNVLEKSKTDDYYFANSVSLTFMKK